MAWGKSRWWVPDRKRERHLGYQTQIKTGWARRMGTSVGTLGAQTRTALERGGGNLRCDKKRKIQDRINLKKRRGESKRVRAYDEEMRAKSILNKSLSAHR